MPDISDGSIEAKVRRRIAGEWVEGWSAAGEFCPNPTAESSLVTLPTAGKCGTAPCPKVALLELAREQKWSAKDTIAALKVLGEK